MTQLGHSQLGQYKNLGIFRMFPCRAVKDHLYFDRDQRSSAEDQFGDQDQRI